MRRREHDRDRTAVALPEHGRAVAPDCVENGSDVVDALLHRRHRVGLDAIREADAALVEDNQTAERCQPLEEPADERALPMQVEMRDPPGHVDEVELAVTEHLVGDVVLPAAGVARLRPVHRPGAYAAALARERAGFAGSSSRRNWPVYDAGTAATCSGVPVAIT